MNGSKSPIELGMTQTPWSDGGFSAHFISCGCHWCADAFERKLHLLARRLILPHPRSGTLDVTARSAAPYAADVRRLRLKGENRFQFLPPCNNLAVALVSESPTAPEQALAQELGRLAECGAVILSAKDLLQSQDLIEVLWTVPAEQENWRIPRPLRVSGRRQRLRKLNGV